MEMLTKFWKQQVAQQLLGYTTEQHCYSIVTSTEKITFCKCFFDFIWLKLEIEKLMSRFSWNILQKSWKMAEQFITWGYSSLPGYRIFTGQLLNKYLKGHMLNVNMKHDDIIRITTQILNHESICRSTDLWMLIVLLPQIASCLRSASSCKTSLWWCCSKMQLFTFSVRP